MSIVTEEAKQAEAQRIELRNAALRRLGAYILAEPRRFDMEKWGIVKGIDGDKEKALLEAQNPPCGTIGCLAGNACVMDGKYRIGYSRAAGEVELYSPSRHRLHRSIEDAAIELLYLTNPEAYKLFYMQNLHQSSDGRPGNFERAYVVEKDLYKKAQIAVNRIEHFIATGK